MDLLEIIKKRRSIRKFNDVKIKDSDLEKIVEAGRYSPTGGNCQSVHFTVITNDDVLNNLRSLVSNAFLKMEDNESLYKSLRNSIKLSKSGNYSYDYNCKCLIILSNIKDYPNKMADSACAIENILLMATSLNIGSCYINQLHWLENDLDLRSYLKTLGIDPDESICGSVALGYSDLNLNENKRTGMKVDYIK